MNVNRNTKENANKHREKKKKQVTDNTESVTFNIDKETLLSLLKRAASRERTVLEFRTVETDDGPVLDSVLEITEHVEELEKHLDT